MKQRKVSFFITNELVPFSFNNILTPPCPFISVTSGATGWIKDDPSNRNDAAMKQRKVTFCFMNELLFFFFFNNILPPPLSFYLCHQQLTATPTCHGTHSAETALVVPIGNYFMHALLPFYFSNTHTHQTCLSHLDLSQLLLQWCPSPTKSLLN